MNVCKKMFKMIHFQNPEKKYSEHSCVPLCSSSKFNSVLSFHGFPAHLDLRRQWVVNIHWDNFTITTQYKVCNRHFATDQLIQPTTLDGQRRLVKGAIPRFFEWSDYTVEKLQHSVWERTEQPIEPVPPEE